MSPRWVALAAAALTFVASCGDPIHDDAVDALGGEAPGERPGPTHRAGQPCLVCHGGSGPGDPQFAFGGTVYAVKGEKDPLSGAKVKLVDAKGVERTATTNSVGNFFVLHDEWAPEYPVKVSVTYGKATATMNTHVGRDGSCAGCHTGTNGPASRDRVHLVVDRADLPEAP